MEISDKEKLAPAILSALCKEYFSEIVVDIDHGSYEALHFSPWMEKYPREGELSDFVTEYVKDYVTGASQEELKRILSMDTIRAYFQDAVAGKTEGDAPLYVDYSSLRYGKEHWCKATVRPLQYGEKGELQLVLVLLQDITVRKSSEIRLQRINRQSEIISALSTLYKEIAVIDLDQGTYELVAGPDNPEVRENRTGTVDRLKAMLLNKNVFKANREEIEAFTDFSTLQERIGDKVSCSDAGSLFRA